jgi:hypothetical protein
LVGGTIHTIDVQERLVWEKRKADTEEQQRIIRAAWTASLSRPADALHDALRLRHRAMMAQDADSRLLLLWSSLERLTAGAPGYPNALSAAKELVSHAVALGKLRRDIKDLTEKIGEAVAKEPSQKSKQFVLVGRKEAGRTEPDRTRVLELLLGTKPDLRQLTDLVYDSAPLLAFRCHELWSAFGSGKPDSRGKSIAEYLERSRARVARQVGRIYRARNRIAHVGAGPEQIRDLVWHSHFYLTQLIAICVHYTESRPEQAQVLLLRRAGQYRAIIQLLKVNDPEATTPNALMRPVSIVSHGDT